MSKPDAIAEFVWLDHLERKMRDPMKFFVTWHEDFEDHSDWFSLDDVKKLVFQMREMGWNIVSGRSGEGGASISNIIAGVDVYANFVENCV